MWCILSEWQQFLLASQIIRFSLNPHHKKASNNVTNRRQITPIHGQTSFEHLETHSRKQRPLKPRLGQHYARAGECQNMQYWTLKVITWYYHRKDCSGARDVRWCTPVESASLESVMWYASQDTMIILQWRVIEYTFNRLHKALYGIPEWTCRSNITSSLGSFYTVHCGIKHG